MPTYVNCNLCSLDNTKTVQKSESPFKVVRCRNCCLVYTNPQPDREHINKHYNESYYRDWIDKQMDRRIPMWRRRLQGLQNHKQKGRLLDVGCGIGTFLLLAEESGYEVWGTEISDFGSRYAGENLALDVYKGDLEEARFPSAHFDIITLWHTLEHVPDPKATLKEIHRILKEDGILVIAVPNLHNFITNILYFLAKGKRLKLFSPQSKEWHFFHFSITTLSALLEKAGFDIIQKDLDLSQIEPSKKTIDYLARFFFILTRKNFGEAMKVYAVKS